LTDIPDNVTNEWIARHLVEFRAEMRRDLRELRGDVDKLIAIVRSMRSEADVTGGILVRVERRLERLEGWEPPALNSSSERNVIVGLATARAARLWFVGRIGRQLASAAASAV
jgi:hypothetical protein